MRVMNSTGKEVRDDMVASKEKQRFMAEMPNGTCRNGQIQVQDQRKATPRSWKGLLERKKL